MKKFFVGLWRGLDGLRKALHLIVLLVLFAVVIGGLSTSAPEIPAKAALVIKPQGYLVDQLSGDPFERALGEAMGAPVEETLVRDVVFALERAKDDDRIQAVVLDLDELLGGGLTKLQAVGAAIDDFRSSGKPVVATGTFYLQPAYYLASRADEVWMNDDGAVFVDGYGRFRNFYKDAIDKLEIDWNVFRVGTYKSFVEPYTRNDMSEADRESSLVWLNGLWDGYRSDVTGARGLESGALAEYSNGLPEAMRADGGNLAATAKRLGLVDHVEAPVALRARMIELVGEDEDRKGTYNAIGLDTYVDVQRIVDPEKPKDENVAVVVAAGPIVDGEAPPGEIGGDSVARLLRKARTDEKVKAIVLRVDSGGGSAVASDTILDEIVAAREAGKPVIASMGSVAASGGYWISMAADEIYAQPATITGSIGVLGMFPTFQRTLAKIGINNDGVGTTDLSGQISPLRAMNEDAREAFQLSVEYVYRDFVSTVAEYRGLDAESVDQVAQGRVWIAQDAKRHGLIDTFGGIEEAIAAAAGRAGLEEDAWGVKYVQPELSPAQRFLLQLVRIGDAAGLEPGQWRDRSALARLADRVEDELEARLLRFNDPRGIYAECFCEVR